MKESIKKKVKLVDDLANELKSVKSLAVVSLKGVPADQLKSLKTSLGLKLRIASKNVLKRALKKVGYDKLIDHLSGPCALLILDKDPFKISIEFSKHRRPVFVKSGTIVGDEVVLEEGPTGLMPGEDMTQLTDLGVKVSPKGGKVTIMERSVILKPGDEVDDDLADLLRKLNIKPVTVGLDLIAVLDNGKLFTQEELIVDVEAVLNNLLLAHFQAVNLSLNANIVNKFTIEHLLLKAFNNAKNLAREAGIITKDNIGEIMLTARAKAQALASTIKWEVKE